MAYLHCHGKLPDGTECGWSQDDFWEKEIVVDGVKKEGYTPLRSDFVQGDIEDLFKDKVYFDRSFFDSNPGLPYKIDEKGLYCKGTNLVAWDLERRARRIRNMLVRTYEEFKEKKDSLACPRCGQKKWDID